MFYINKTRNFIKKTIRNFVKENLKVLHPIINAINGIVTKLVTFYRKHILKEKRFIYKNRKDLPTKVRIETCSFCQLNCVQCPTKTQHENMVKNKRYGYLKFENYKNFIDDNPQIREIEISNNGEIFLNPDLEKIIKYSYDKDITLTAKNGVNLNSLSDEMAENLVKYNFREMYVSMDAATPEIYEIYRKGGDFNKVIENIKKINKYKELYNSKYPILTYKFIVFGHNEHEIPLAKDLAQKLNMKIKFTLNWNKEYSPIKNIDFVRQETGIEIRKKTDSYDKMRIKTYKEETSNNILCNFLFDNPQIDWDGRLLGCCCTTHKFFGGNVFEDGFINVLNSETVIYAKKMLTDFKTKPREDIPCKHCTYYKGLKRLKCEMKR